MQEDMYSEKRNYYAEGILKSVSVMFSIIENILELARLENLRMLLARENIILPELIKEVMKQFQVEIRLKELKVSLEGEEDGLRIWADRSLMKRALENLIGNAVKYTPKGHEIIVTENMKCCEIKNTGVMIPEDKLPYVWEPFIKGEIARTEINGTGIGLTIEKEIMDLHGFNCEIKNGDNCVIMTIDFGEPRGSKGVG